MDRRVGKSANQQVSGADLSGMDRRGALKAFRAEPE